MKSLQFKDGLPLSTKKRNRAYHGFGMKSMKHLTEKYGGTLVSKPGEKYFHVTDHSADAEGICAVVEREKEI